MDIFSQASREKAAGGRLPNMRDGAYKLIVDRCHVKDGYKGVTLVVELGVEESRATEPGVAPNPAGTFLSCVWNTEKNRDSAIGKMTQFVIALMGIDESVSDERIQNLSRQVFSTANPARGMRINATTYQTENQGTVNPMNKGKMMTFPNFDHVPGQTEQSRAECLALLDAMKVGTYPAPQAQPAAPAAQPAQPAQPAQAPSLLGTAQPTQPAQGTSLLGTAQPAAPAAQPAQPAQGLTAFKLPG